MIKGLLFYLLLFGVNGSISLPEYVTMGHENLTPVNLGSAQQDTVFMLGNNPACTFEVDLDSASYVWVGTIEGVVLNDTFPMCAWPAGKRWLGSCSEVTYDPRHSYTGRIERGADDLVIGASSDCVNDNFLFLPLMAR